ncbi:protein xmas [Ochlerotatus camptorhynchus]|uniref:protein xmas n=1 Tax=Ochlerotatus camptorhynchus TaxID=644619 RepID=UPI0031D2CD22
MSDDGVIVIEDSPQRKSISCEQIPELFLDKLIAKKHFSQFGRIYRFILRPKRLSCTVEYENAEAAEAALARSGLFRDVKFNVYWTDEAPAAVVGGSSRDEGFVDPEVQQELDTMSGGPSSLRTKQSIKQSIESFLKQTERFPMHPVLAPPKPLRMPMMAPPRNNIPSADPKAFQAKMEFESLARKPALTAEERFRLLDARDKYIRFTMDRTTDIRKAKSTQGTCKDMCPEKERYMRECKFQVASYEAGESSQQIDHAKAIKQYSRSSADQEAPLALELRSENGLELAMSYLLIRIADLCDEEDVNLSDWFHFLWDRTRGIRKDITQQELGSLRAVRLVEQCARFHIHCAARLVAEEPSVFDQKINTENMTKCLQSLKYMYHDLGLKGIRCPAEAEFRAYVVLLNLNDGNFLWEVKQLAGDIMHSQEIRFALQVYFALESNNYARFFRLVRQTTYMNACILLRYFNQIRTRALETMLRAYTYRTPASFSLDHLIDLLAFEDTEAAASFLDAYNLPIDLSLGTVLMDPKQYERPDLPYQLERAFNLVECKRTCSVGEAISGQPLQDESILDNHQLENSFTPSGYFREDLLRSILKPSKIPDPSSPVNDDDKVFKVPSPTSISPKPLFPKPTTNSNLFLSSRNSYKIETNSPAPSVPSFFSKESPTNLSGITALPQQAEQQPKPTAFGANLFGNVNFASPKTRLFGSIPVAKTSSEVDAIFRGPTPTFPSMEQARELATKRLLEEEMIRKQQQEEDAKRKRQQVEQELRRKREAEEERIRQELIARKEAEIRRLKEMEEQSKRELEETVRKMSEKIYAELVDDVCGQEVGQIATTCHNQYQLLEKYPKKLLKELEDEVVLEFLVEMVREETLVKNCQENRQLNVMRKYFRLWWKNVRMVTDNRMQIENSPAWLPERELQEQAKECYQEHQALSLANMKRYVGGMPKVFQLPERKEEQVDVFEIVRRQITTVQKKDLRGFIKNHVYWKITISIPFKQEEDSSGFYYFINKWLKSLFKRSSENDGKCFFLEVQENVTARERLAVCMRLLKGISIFDELNTNDPKALDNSDGLVFFLASNNVAISKQRLHNLLRKADSWGPLPVTIIAYNYQPNSDESLEDQLDLDLLLEEGKISDFEIVYHHETRKTPLRQALLKSLALLASYYNADSPLEMQSQTSFIGTCLGEELWYRFRLSSQQNPKLNEACQNLPFVVDLFNQAINRVSNLVQHNLTAYPDFPAEFKPFVSKRRFDIPLDLEYFPKDWRDPDRQQKLVRFFTQLKLKAIIFDAAALKSLQDLQSHLRPYIRSLLPKPNEKAARRLLALVTQEILRALPTGVPFPQAITTLNWLSPISILSNELLRHRWSEALVQLPCEVIYHKQEYESYTRTLWWLPELKKLKRRSTTDDAQLQISTNGEGLDTGGSENDDGGYVDSLDGSLALAALPAAKKMKLNISLAKDDLDEILARGRRCLERADEKLTQCRAFTQQTRDLANKLDGQLYEQEKTFRENRWTWEANFR